MVKGDRISGFFWLAFGLFVTEQSHRLGLGTLRRPGPGFLFFYAGIFASILSFLILVRAWTSKMEGGGAESIFGKKNMKKLCLVVISLFVYAFLMEGVGFIPVTLLLFLFLLGVVEKKKWTVTVLISLIVTVVAYILFETFLQSQLPKGILSSLRF